MSLGGAVSAIAMQFNCLIFCDEPKSLSVLRAAMEKCEMRPQVCTQLAEAERLLKSSRVNCVVADCDDLDQGRQFLKNIRSGRSNRSAVSLAIVNGNTSVRDAYAMGANFVLEKPLLADLLLRTLRAGQGFMLAQERHIFRRPVDIEATVKSETGTHRFQARNISENGIRLKNVGGLLKARQLVTLTFWLPGRDTRVECKGEVLWVHPSGEAGLSLTYDQAAYAKKVQSWLREQFEHRPIGANRASDLSSFSV